MNKRLRTSSQADAEESSGPGLSLDEHTAVIMSRSVVVERHIQLADFYELRFEDRTLPEMVEQADHILARRARFIFGYVRDVTAFPNANDRGGPPTKAEVFRTLLGPDTAILEGSNMLHGQLLPFWRIMHLILCSTIDPKKHTTELSYGRAEFLYMVVVRGLHVDMASFIYQSVRAEALKTDAQISLPYGVLLTQFLHNLMVPEGADEPRELPLGSINKTTLSKSMAQTRRVLGAAWAARARREEPAQGTEEQDPGQGSSQGLEGQQPSWVASMMTS
ncbi:hypothetical protein CJ030_MR0G002163 [Morella rubra]|uniref:Uncharacterized protein n=1 Tax=Morella rubra TaxID=262757 RepID=A0A6A1UML2_9ROSI|nr:hypothetical protein CJ030_MR0G002163 [Morella rubra]